MIDCLFRLPGCLLMAAAAVALNGAAESLTLVRDGEPSAVVVLPPEPLAAESAAAADLIEYVGKISGAVLPAETVAPDALEAFVNAAVAEGRAPILLGRAAPALAAGLAARGNVLGSFGLVVTVDRLSIAGIGDGVTYGVSELLERLGVRWFMPGELGTVVPTSQTIALPVGEVWQAPSFPGRNFQMAAPPEWFRRMRCGGIPVFPGAHGLPGAAKALFETHPECFSLIDGERQPRQHCLSNPYLLQTVIAAVKEWAAGHPNLPAIGIGPNDGAGFCECAACRKLDSGDFDPFSSETSVTDRYIWFFNQVQAGIADEYPDLKLAFYIYHNYMRPPVRVKPHPNIIGALAPIALCRIHGPNNPVCPEKQYYAWLANEWGKLMPEVWERGYWSNLACPGFPFIIVHRLREQIPMCKTAGIKGWRVETFSNWGPQFPSFYVAAKLMWNAETDVTALMQDISEKFFGPAAAPMGRYLALMDGALRDADHHTGCAWDMPFLYPAEIRQAARPLLDEGAKLAPADSIYGRRVRMITSTFDLLTHFIDMLAARNAIDFVAAKGHLEKLDALAEELKADDPPMLVAGRFSTYTNYMRRFYRPCTEGGYQRLTEGNRLVAACRDQWSFLIDSTAVGESLGWWRPAAGGNWRTISSSSSWSNQGLRYYRGLAWYRQTVAVPAEFAGQRVFIWFGGVDEKARVWLNGEPLGISHGAAFYPFELDATAAVRPGADNVVTVCVANERVNELGTGGIVAPVFLYAPAAGAAAELDNTRPLGRTFP